MNKSDESVAKEVQKGSAESFGIIIERYEPKLLRYGKKFLYQYEDVEDAVQDVFIKAFTNINSFNIERKFSPWIYRIAHNTFINLIKKRGREPLTFFDPDTIFGAAITSENPETNALKVELSVDMQKAVSTLPPKYREPIVLFFYEEKDYKEISDIMRIPTSTVGVRIRRAKEKISKILEENG